MSTDAGAPTPSARATSRGHLIGGSVGVLTAVVAAVVFHLSADGTHGLDVFLGTVSPFSAADWWSVPLAVVGYLVVPAVVGAVVSLLIDVRIASSRLTEAEHLRRLDDLYRPGVGVIDRRHGALAGRGRTLEDLARSSDPHERSFAEECLQAAGGDRRAAASIWMGALDLEAKRAMPFSTSAGLEAGAQDHLRQLWEDTRLRVAPVPQPSARPVDEGAVGLLVDLLVDRTPNAGAPVVVLGPPDPDRRDVALRGLLDGRVAQRWSDHRVVVPCGASASRRTLVAAIARAIGVGELGDLERQVLERLARSTPSAVVLLDDLDPVLRRDGEQVVPLLRELARRCALVITCSSCPVSLPSDEVVPGLPAPRVLLEPTASQGLDEVEAALGALALLPDGIDLGAAERVLGLVAGSVELLQASGTVQVIDLGEGVRRLLLADREAGGTGATSDDGLTSTQHAAVRWAVDRGAALRPLDTWSAFGPTTQRLDAARRVRADASNLLAVLPLVGGLGAEVATSAVTGLASLMRWDRRSGNQLVARGWLSELDDVTTARTLDGEVEWWLLQAERLVWDRQRMEAVERLDDAVDRYAPSAPLFAAAAHKRAGDALFGADQLDRAHERYEQARLAYDAERDGPHVAEATLGLANVLTCQAEVELRWGRHATVERTLVTADQLLARVREPVGQGNVAFYQAELALEQGALDVAEQAYGRAERHYRGAGVEMGRANCLLRLVELHAIASAAVDVRSLVDQLGAWIATEPRGRGHLASVGAIAAARGRRWDEARAELEEAANAYREAPDHLGLAWVGLLGPVVDLASGVPATLPPVTTFATIGGAADRRGTTLLTALHDRRRGGPSTLDDLGPGDEGVRRLLAGASVEEVFSMPLSRTFLTYSMLPEWRPAIPT